MMETFYWIRLESSIRSKMCLQSDLVGGFLKVRRKRENLS